MYVLGIETSCDETAAAVVRDGRHVLSNVINTQIAQHRPYGGVVPEIASRAHVEVLPDVVEEALKDAGVSWSDIDAIAATRGPGLSSSLLVGFQAARSLALRMNLPLIPVNHLEAHLCAAFLGEDAPDPDDFCPMIALLVSGGHTCLIRMDSARHFRMLGQTLDDAAGEALDKGASLMGLGYPGGVAIQNTAVGGNPYFVKLPRGLKNGGGGQVAGGLQRELCFSFSGLKTALRYFLEKTEDRSESFIRDVAASYQEAVVDALTDRLRRALKREGIRHVSCGGGVARNALLRERLGELAEEMSLELHLAPFDYCTDNAAMIAALAGSGLPAMDPCFEGLDVHPNLPIGSEI